MSIREFFFGHKKDDNVIQRSLGVVFDVMRDDWVELEFRNPDKEMTVHHLLHLPGHHLRIGEFVTLEYRRGR